MDADKVPAKLRETAGRGSSFYFSRALFIQIQDSNFEHADILEPFNLVKTKVVLAWKKIQKCTL